MADGCVPCNGTGGASFLPPTNINTCPLPTGGPVDASCVKYTGPALTCSGVATNSWLEDILQEFDTKLCEAGADWSAFEYNCLADDYSIETPAEFVDAITTEFCSLRADFTTFSGTTYPAGISNLQTQITQIVNPNLTLCAGSGITSSDTYTSILNKLATLGCDNKTALDVSGANWNSCFSTPTLPTTPTAGFNVILAKLCDLINNPVVTPLPTFNNQGSCLASPGTADTLVSTINKIKTRLCLSPIYDINTSPWGCIANPAVGTGPNLQAAFDAVLNQVNTLKSHDVTFDPDFFEVTDTVSGQPCQGRTVTFVGDVTQDRFVASDSSDTDPGTLADKLTAGTNITLDNITTPGQIIINSTGVDQLVKSSSSDPSAGYLNNKVNGVNNTGQGIQITAINNGTTNQVDFTPSIDEATFIGNLFNVIEDTPELYDRFCALMCGCGPCGGSTTTTTIGAIGRVAFRIVNPGATTINMRLRFDQNAPSLGLFNGDISLGAGLTFDSGYYDLSTPIVPLTGVLTVDNLDDTSPTFSFNAQVKYPNGSSVPGSSTASATVDPAYTNTSFSLGSIYTDVIVVITITV